MKIPLRNRNHIVRCDFTRIMEARYSHQASFTHTDGAIINIQTPYGLIIPVSFVHVLSSVMEP